MSRGVVRVVRSGTRAAADRIRRAGQPEARRAGVHRVDADAVQQRVGGVVVANGQHGRDQVAERDPDVVAEQREARRPGRPGSRPQCDPLARVQPPVGELRLGLQRDGHFEDGCRDHLLPGVKSDLRAGGEGLDAQLPVAPGLVEQRLKCGMHNPILRAGRTRAQGGYPVIAVAWDQTTCQVSSWSR